MSYTKTFVVCMGVELGRYGKDFQKKGISIRITKASIVFVDVPGTTFFRKWFPKCRINGEGDRCNDIVSREIERYLAREHSQGQEERMPRKGLRVTAQTWRFS